jgi:hypothetical protein
MFVGSVRLYCRKLASFEKPKLARSVRLRVHSITAGEILSQLNEEVYNGDCMVSCNVNVEEGKGRRRRTNGDLFMPIPVHAAVPASHLVSIQMNLTPRSKRGERETSSDRACVPRNRRFMSHQFS